MKAPLTRLHVRRRGAGAPVVLVHGSNGVSFDFPDALLDDLAADHLVLAPDRPGHGHSPRGDGALDLASNARAVLAVVRGANAGPAVLVGHSYGAAVVLRAALDEPSLVRAVLAVTPAAVVDPRNARWALAGRAPSVLAPLVWLVGLPVGLLVASRVRRTAWHPASPPRGTNASRAFALCPDQIAHAGENAASLRADLERLAADLPRLAVPLAVLAGADDLITPPALHLPPLREVPGARVEVVPGVGHWLPIVHAERVGAVVRELERAAGSPGGSLAP